MPLFQIEFGMGCLLVVCCCFALFACLLLCGYGMPSGFGLLMFVLWLGLLV